MNRTFPMLVLLPLIFLTGCGDSLTFVDFSAPDGSYKVKLPGKPNRASTGGANADVWEVVTGRWNFGVGHITLPTNGAAIEASRQSFALDSGLNGMASGIKGTVKSKNSITLNGYPGLEAELSVPAGPNPTTGKPEPASTAIVRIYLVDSKVYMLFARSVSSITKDSPNVKTFYDSFVLNATAGPGAASGGMPGMAGMPGGPTAMPGAGPGGTQIASAAPSGTYNSSGTYQSGGPMPMMTPMPNGTYPPPSGTYPPPSGTYPPPAGTNPAGTYVPPMGSTNPMGTYNSSGTYTTGGGNPMAPATVNGNGSIPMMPPSAIPMMPPSAIPMMPPMGIPGMPPGAFPGTNPMDMNPGATIPGVPGGTGLPPNQPQFTGTPVTNETKLSVGDIVQATLSGQWVDVKVMQIAPTGQVQIRTQNKPYISGIVAKSTLQFAPGVTPPAVASADSPEADSSGAPSSTGFQKPRSSRPPTAPLANKEVAKGTGSVNLDGASVEELLKIIANKNEHRRVPAAEQLAQHSQAGSDPEVAKQLVELLKTDELTVRAAVAVALEKWATPEIYDSALKNLSGGTTEVRQSMMRIVAANKVDGAAAAIVKCLADREDRKVAVESLIQIGEPAQADVIRLLSHRDSKVKLAACEILKEIGTADGVAALKKATETWTGTDRLAARKALLELEAKK